MATDDKFIVRVDAGRFLQGWDGQSVTVCDVPSYALHLSYSAADQWAQRLRKRRFPEAVVCDVFGTIMKIGMVREHLQEIRAAEVEDLPKTLLELSRIPVNEQKKLYSKSAAFRERWDQLNGV